MTKEEAINNLEDLWNEVYNEDSDGYVYAEAIDIAIEALKADVVSRDIYDKRTQADEKIIDSYRQEFQKALHNVIKKPRTVRYKLHKPIEYISIEFDEEEVITHIEHYNEVVRCKDCRFNKYPSNDLCLIKKAGIYPDDDDFCSYGERREL